MNLNSLALTGFLTETACKTRPVSARERTKRAFDVLAATAGLLLAAPALLLLGILVKLTSKGPALYKQVRAGRNGNPFRMYKLRTMYADAEAGGPRWCADSDPRVTPLGRFLRRTHLDELPQLWNVLQGDMSIIGPRPERPCFIHQLKGVVPLYTTRLAVKPGITGLAQIRHRSDQTIEDVQTKLGYDLEYIKRACLMLDLHIVALTAVKVVTSFNRRA
jgi:lipopolysaccharide/colanic/teichoic acid biosynthesis glycosyltransferase